MTVALPAPTQLVIDVAGGTAASPFDPLAPVGDRPLLSYLLWHARRFGFDRVLLLTDQDSGALSAFAREEGWADGLAVEVLSDAAPLGSAGRLRRAISRLDPALVWVDGGSLFDFNWLGLQALSVENPRCPAAVALRPDGASGGVCLLHRTAIAAFTDLADLQRDILPELVASGRAVGRVMAGDIYNLRSPEALEAARTTLPASLRRGAVFFDRDGVINVNHGYVHRWDQFDWIEGAAAAIKSVNDRNLFAFLVTNQSGVARGYYEEAAIGLLHGQLQTALRDQGAHLDDIRYCPHLPDAPIERYASACGWRKPGPGMILDLAARWPVDMDASLLVGDSPSDLEAAAAAGIPGTLFEGGDLERLVKGLIGG